MGFIIFMFIAYCIFYAIPKSLYRDELKRSNNPLTAIFAVIIPVVLCVIFAICYNMENQKIGTYIFMAVNAFIFILVIYAHWYKWKEKREKQRIESILQGFPLDHNEYFKQVQQHQNELDMIKQKAKKYYRNHK